MKKSEKSYKEYVPRNVSWMFFNYRILQEAEKKNVPLLERLGFLGIYSNNLDEFFRVRVALLNRIAECDDKETKNDRQEAVETLKVINKLNASYAKEYEHAIHKVTEDLKKVIDYALSDNMQGRMVDGTGVNLPWQTDGPTPFRSQEAIYNSYKTE